ncbi:MAG TPA: hypothetical protein VKR06_40070 [Ktedonosporobacter sp.]|nr:hypothetical protein [Ktedonosporobacter sp.]
MMQRITTTRTEHVALVTIALQFEPERKLVEREPTKAQQSTRYFLENLRPLVRKTDEVILLGQTCYFMLLRANLQGARIVQDRLWDALLWRVHNIMDEEILHPQGMSIGHSAYPGSDSSINTCIEAASVACMNFNILPEKSPRQQANSLTFEITSAAGGASIHKRSGQAASEGELPNLARKLGIPYLSLLPHKLPIKVQRLVNPQLAQELHCYPVGRERDILTVAMSNPQDREALDRLARETGLHIFPVLTHPQELETALARLV